MPRRRGTGNDGRKKATATPLQRRVVAFVALYAVALLWTHRTVQETRVVPASDADGLSAANTASPPSPTAVTALDHENVTTNSLPSTQPTWRNLTDAELQDVRSLRGWDGQPIVLARYKLLFFTQPKVASTVFKQLFRRMMRHPDWYAHQEPVLPHDPRYNRLQYMVHVPLRQWSRILTGSDWTRAVFVRDPKERVLSAYLDKGQRKDGAYVYNHCCATSNRSYCAEQASRSFRGFLRIISEHCCCDPHWIPQSRRMADTTWRLVNFVGRFESLQEDTKRMLDRISPTAWDTFGASGWGDAHNESIFSQHTHAKHYTHASQRAQEHYGSTDVNALAEAFYAEDYANHLLSFHK